jgi:hypothetical protein
MNKIKFILYVTCIPKGKRKLSNVKYNIHSFDKELFENNKEELTKQQLDHCRFLMKKEEDNKNIKNVTAARLIIREIEEDEKGIFESYVPTNDITITII